jgi:hypothetical protein
MRTSKMQFYHDIQDTIMRVCPISMANPSGEKECIGERCLFYMSHPIEAYPITHPVEGKCRLLTYLQSH